MLSNAEPSFTLLLSIGTSFVTLGASLATLGQATSPPHASVFLRQAAHRSQSHFCETLVFTNTTTLLYEQIILPCVCMCVYMCVD